MRDTNPPRKETMNNNPNISMMRALQRSEFIKDLFWDVDGIEDPSEGESSLPVISPRVQVEICAQPMEMLVDSGSEVTPMSEAVNSPSYQ